MNGLEPPSGRRPLAGLGGRLEVPESADRIDAYVLAEMKRQHIPGAWLMVREDGKVAKLKGYGIANLETGARVSRKTRMQTGSIGKMFAAAGIMLLVQDGKLRLEDSIATHFPRSPEWWKPITVRHLLAHTSGVPEYAGERGLDLRREYTEDELVRFAQGQRPDFAPGERWSYSNTGYMVLGVLIHRVAGEFYGDFLRRRIWDPCGLPTMRVISDRELIPHRSAGYDWVDGRWLNQGWVSASLNSTADGSLYATPADLVAWDRALDAGSVLAEPLQEAMWTSSTLYDGSATGYGYGWEIGEYLGHRFVGHNGAWQGFTSAYLRFRTNSLSVAVFVNCSGTAPEKIAKEIAARFFHTS